MSELYHWGVKGMKWGVRRYQNKDGSLTSAGKNRYSDDSGKKELTPEERNAKIKKAVKIGAAVAGTILVAYGAKKLVDFRNNKIKQADRAAIRKWLEEAGGHPISDSKFREMFAVADARRVVNGIPMPSRKEEARLRKEEARLKKLDDKVKRVINEFANLPVKLERGQEYRDPKTGKRYMWA